MIIFYNKKTKDIIGVVVGRVHSPQEVESSWVQPSTMVKEDVGKYVVPFVSNEEKTELKPDVTFADLIYDFEKGKKRIYDYKIKVDKGGEIIGFEKK